MLSSDLLTNNPKTMITMSCFIMTEYVYNRNTSHVHHPFVRSKERVIQLDVFYTVTLRDVLCHFYNVLFVRTMFSVLIIHFLQSSLEYCELFHFIENNIK